MKPTNPMDKAAAAFKKQEQQREGAKAMAEYQAGQQAQQKKIERLRALRLEHESAQQAVKKEKRNTGRAKRKSA